MFGGVNLLFYKSLIIILQIVTVLRTEKLNSCPTDTREKVSSWIQISNFLFDFRVFIWEKQFVNKLTDRAKQKPC